ATSDASSVKALRTIIEIFSGLSHVRAMSETENPGGESTLRSADSRKPTEPCSIVIFGASGDLTARKLIPALYHLFKDQQMPSSFRVIGFARREKTDD